MTNLSKEFSEMEVKPVNKISYLIKKIDITDILISKINSEEWHTIIEGFRKEPIIQEKESNDCWIELKINNIDYEINLDFFLEREGRYNIYEDYSKTYNWVISNYEIDYKLFKDEGEQTEDIEIVWDIDKICKKIKED